MPSTASESPLPHRVDVFFNPRTIAVIGATEEAESFGRSALWNLISNPFGGTVYPVNPQRRSVLGIKAYPRISDVPEPVDLAMIVTPAATVPSVVAECAAAGVKAGIIVTSGFRSAGTAGLDMEQQALAAARATGMRLLGPNSMGLMRPRGNLNASCSRGTALPGKLAFISHSAALAAAVLDWSLKEQIGFSHFVSLGSMIDVHWGDMLDYLANDPATESIVIFIETVGNARAFLSAAREAALAKPLIVLKAGRTEATAQVAASHTGNLAESDAVLEAALNRCGALRVTSMADMFAMAELLARQPRPLGPRLAIITNAGGTGVLAADALLATGGALAELSPTTVSELDLALPKGWSHANPIDLQGGAQAETFDKALEITAKDKNNDGLLVIFNPTIMSQSTATAQLIQRHSHKTGKPLLASWMGGDTVAEGAQILQNAGIPMFDYPDTAARAFHYMWQYSRNLRSLYETPSLLPDESVQPERVAEIIAQARSEQRTVLSEVESKHLIEAYGLPICETYAATSPEDAVEIAHRIGYPVVLKLLSPQASHKTDFGGVRLNLRNASEVRHAYSAISTAAQAHGIESHSVTVQPMISGHGYELLLGSSIDQQFGPVILFGTGGDLVEVMRDRAIGLPPLNTTLARRIMEQTRIFQALPGVRGRPPIDIGQLERLMVRFSQLVAEQPMIKEIDINPLYVEAGRIMALDARVVLHEPELAPEELPRIAIRPYPAQYVAQARLRDGSTVTIRPIRPEDEPLMIDFHQSVSEQSIYYRFFRTIDYDRRIEHERLSRVCFLDYDRELALVAIQPDPKSGRVRVIGVGRLSRQPNSQDAEFALLITDRFQGQGLGRILLERLIEIGRSENARRIVGYVLPENRGMLKLAEKVGFKVKRSFDMAEAVYEL